MASSSSFSTVAAQVEATVQASGYFEGVDLQSLMATEGSFKERRSDAKEPTLWFNAVDDSAAVGLMVGYRVRDGRITLARLIDTTPDWRNRSKILKPNEQLKLILERV